MTEASLAFTDPDQILRLFGAQDRYLRQVRDVVGVDVTLRGDEIRLHGTDEQIKRGLAVFAEMPAIFDKRGEQLPTAVPGVLHLGAPSHASHGDSPEPHDMPLKSPPVHP